MDGAFAGSRDSAASKGVLERATLDRVYAALGRIPLFDGVRQESCRIRPLGSLTNASYKVTYRGQAYALRLPGDDTFEYVDRDAEHSNGRLATAAGINAETLFFDAADGTMLSRFIEGTALDGESLCADPAGPARAARLLRRVHGLGRAFEGRFDVFAMTDNYLGMLRRLWTLPPKGYHEVEKGAEEIRRALSASPGPLVPCHNDPWPRNFLDAGERLYLIDWEFSGMNDPCWDLGDLSVEAGFGPGQDRAMLEAYRGGAAPEALYSRLELYKALSDLLWALWGFVQHANDNPRDDFLSYAQTRLEHCQERMDAADFGRHLSLVLRAGRPAEAPHRHVAGHAPAAARNGKLRSPEARKAAPSFGA